MEIRRQGVIGTPLTGQLAAEALLSQMNGRKVAEHILIEPALVLRGSV